MNSKTSSEAFDAIAASLDDAIVIGEGKKKPA